MRNELTDEELETYSRQIVLADIGYDGQLKLRNARVCVVGVGGLGSPVALKLVGMGGLIATHVQDALSELYGLTLGGGLEAPTDSVIYGRINGTWTSTDDVYSALGHVHAWTDITTGVPTTLAGYGIADTKANYNIALSDGTFLYVGDAPTAHVHDWTDITTGVPTTLAGYGITDSHTKTEANSLIAGQVAAALVQAPTIT